MMIILLLCFTQALVAQTSSFVITDTNGRLLEHPVVGEQFIITCSIAGEYKDDYCTSIQRSFAGLQVINSSIKKSISIMNGARSETTTISWIVRALKQGAVRLGSCDVGSTHINALEIAIKLERAATTSGPRVELRAAHLQGFEHQALPISLICTVPTTAKNIRFDFADHLKGACIFDQSVQKVPVDRNYMQLKYSGYLTLTKAGTLIVPACVVSYEEERTRSFGFFSSNQTVTNQIFSNALQIVVKKFNQSVHAIGVLTNYSCELIGSPSKDAQTHTIHVWIEGDKAALLTLKAPGFSDLLPIRYYQGKTTVYDNKLCIEYVVQGLENGTYTVGPEDLRYLDTALEKVHTITSNKIALTFNAIVHDHVDYDDQPDKTIDTIRHESKPVITDFSVSSWYTYTMPKEIYIFLTVIMLSIFGWLLCGAFLVRNLVLISLPLRLLLYSHSNLMTFKRFKQFFIVLCDVEKEPTLEQIHSCLSGTIKANLLQQCADYYQLLEQYSFDGSTKHLPKKQQRELALYLIKVFFNRSWRRKAVKLSALIIGLCFMDAYATNTQQELAQRIAQLRTIQMYVPTHKYIAIEREIQALYNDADIPYARPTAAIILGAVTHILPNAIAQLLCCLVIMVLSVVAFGKIARCGLFGLFCLSFFIVCGYVYEKNYTHGLVVANLAHLKNGPGLEYLTLAQIPFLQELRILTVYDSWTQIKYNGKIGWIPQSDVLIVESLN